MHQPGEALLPLNYTALMVADDFPSQRYVWVWFLLPPLFCNILLCISNDRPAAAAALTLMVRSLLPTSCCGMLLQLVTKYIIQK
mmetsp:Transcript_36381/g.63068  ORF Transcript_36381/g.63068 Transcript_36381/m.63068 type:complete len:84 (+) Transcript_36381:431-682(+)